MEGPPILKQGPPPPPLKGQLFSLRLPFHSFHTYFEISNCSYLFFFQSCSSGRLPVGLGSFISHSKAQSVVNLGMFSHIPFHAFHAEYFASFSKNFSLRLFQSFNLETRLDFGHPTPNLSPNKRKRFWTAVSFHFFLWKYVFSKVCFYDNFTRITCSLSSVGVYSIPIFSLIASICQSQLRLCVWT